MALRQNLSIQWREFQINFINCNRPYRISTLQSNYCDNKTMFVFIASRPDSFAVRTAIRQTWAKDMQSDTFTRFIIGAKQDSNVASQLVQEIQTFGDIILVDIPDTYRLLFIKVYAAFQWQQVFCPKVKWVLKIDDDSIVNVDRLRFWMTKRMEPIRLKYPSTIFGRLISFSTPSRSVRSKWHIPRDDYSGRFYPTYAYGNIYILSNNAVIDILRQTEFATSFAIEDALFTGTLARMAGINTLDISMHLAMFRWRPTRGLCENGTPYLMMLANFRVKNKSEIVPKYSQEYDAFQKLPCHKRWTWDAIWQLIDP
ncbi:galactosyltransferase domain-containing protein [Ditylenchus destructor]|nr:galactosyltransferase domain-containing protein [Ditylenchus destructor]